MITSYTRNSQWLTTLIKDDFGKNILIVDWQRDILNSDLLKHELEVEVMFDSKTLFEREWHTGLQKIKNTFLRDTEKYDFVLIVTRETWQGMYEETYERNYRKYGDIDQELRNRGNIYFLTFSESFFYNTTTPQNRTLSLPWFYSNWYTGGIHHSPNFTPDIDYIEKDYTFNMLLGKQMKKRKEIFDRLENRKDIYKTYFGEDKYKTLSDVHLEDENTKQYLMSKSSSEALQTFHNIPVPYDVDFGDSRRFIGEKVSPALSHTIPEKIYKNTNFDIVCETTFWEPTNKIKGWTSEKTAKPIITGRFFIWFGCVHTSMYLKKFGYELDSYVLNGYDNELDYENRFNKILELISECNNINYIKKVYNDTKPARLHNMNVAKDGIRNSLTTIQDWIGDKLNE